MRKATMRMPRPYRVSSGLSDWARQVLSAPLDAVLGTVNRDGSPHLVPVGFGFDEGRFLIPTGSTTRKARNAERDPRARVLVMAPVAVTGEDDGWVAADGHAEVVHGQQALKLNRLAVDRYLTEEGKRGFEKVFAPIMDVTIVVTPWSWQTWQSIGMLETMREHGYTYDDIARWYIQRQ